MTPIVSVVMSVYNGERYLRESVESILNQTFTDFEFIIINDGSTDKTREILEEYAVKDKRVILVQQENMGLTKSLNKGIALAKGKYIARQDADDVSKPERFERQVNFMEDNLSVGLLGSLFEFIDEKGNMSGIRELPLEDKVLKERLPRINQFCHASVMIRKVALETVGVYRDFFKYAQDYDLWLRIAEEFEIKNLPDPLVSYRESEEAVSSEKILMQSLYAGAASEMARQRTSIGTDELNLGNVPSLPPAHHLSEELGRYLIEVFSKNPEKILKGLDGSNERRDDLAYLFDQMCDQGVKIDSKLSQELGNALFKKTSPADELVSVIIPTYNGKEWIADAIDSVLKQTHACFEIIVIDDGSTDNTGSYLKERYGNVIRYFYQENRGLAATRNKGLDEAKGSYIQFLDCDDLLLPEKLAFQVNAIRNLVGPALSISDYRPCDIDDISMDVPGRYLSPIPINSDPLIDLISRWETEFSIPAHCFLFNATFFRTCGIRFDETLPNHEDWDCWMKIFTLKPVVKYIGQKLALYRIRQTSMCYDFKEMKYGYLKAIQKQILLLKDDIELIDLLSKKRARLEYSDLYRNVRLEETIYNLDVPINNDQDRLIAGWDKLVVQRDQQLVEQDRHLAELEKLLLSKNDEIELLRIQTAERDKAISEKTVMIRDMETQLVEKAVTIRNMENQLLEKTAEVVARDERIEQIAEEVARESQIVEEHLTRLQEEHEAEKEELLREKDKRIEELLNSMSWKITKPLRALYSILLRQKK